MIDLEQFTVEYSLKNKDSLLEHALNYTKKGFSVIPINKKTKIPSITWLEFQERIMNETEIEKYFNNNNTNIGIVLGNISNCVNFDFDEVLPFIKFLDLWNKKHPQETLYKSTWCFISSKVKIPFFSWSKVHIAFRYIPDVATMKKYAGSFEFLSDKTQTIVPPSIHKRGSRYKTISKTEEPIVIPKEELEYYINELSKFCEPIQPFVKRMKDRKKVKELKAEIKELEESINNDRKIMNELNKEVRERLITIKEANIRQLQTKIKKIKFGIKEKKIVNTKGKGEILINNKQNFSIENPYDNNSGLYEEFKNLSPHVKALISRIFKGEHLDNAYVGNFIVGYSLIKNMWTDSQIHEIYKNDPHYDAKETQKKINFIRDKYQSNSKPLTCSFIQKNGFCLENRCALFTNRQKKQETVLEKVKEVDKSIIEKKETEIINLESRKFNESEADFILHFYSQDEKVKQNPKKYKQLEDEKKILRQAKSKDAKKLKKELKELNNKLETMRSNKKKYSSKDFKEIHEQIDRIEKFLNEPHVSRNGMLFLTQCVFRNKGLIGMQTIDGICPTDSNDNFRKKNPLKANSPFNDEFYNEQAKKITDNDLRRLEPFGEIYYHYKISGVKENEFLKIKNEINKETRKNYNEYRTSKKVIRKFKTTFLQKQNYWSEPEIYKDKFTIHLICPKKIIVDDSLEELDNNFFTSYLPKLLKKWNLEVEMKQVENKLLNSILLKINIYPYQLIEYCQLSEDRNKTFWKLKGNDEVFETPTIEFAKIFRHYRRGKELGCYQGGLSDRENGIWRRKLGYSVNANGMIHEANKKEFDKIIENEKKKNILTQKISEKKKEDDIQAIEKLVLEKKDLNKKDKESWKIIKENEKSHFCYPCFKRSQKLTKLLIKIIETEMFDERDLYIEKNKPPPIPITE